MKLRALRQSHIGIADNSYATPIDLCFIGKFKEFEGYWKIDSSSYETLDSFNGV